MELSKHENHRNTAYLNWLRKQDCVVTGEKAECAHHIRLGTNGGSSLKPSDYFCIPLLNEFHSSGMDAIHNIGEETFAEKFQIKTNELFVWFLKKFILEKFGEQLKFTNTDQNEQIAYMIQLIEEKTTRREKAPRKPKAKESITQNEYYQKAKEEKNIRDRELRMRLKEEAKLLDKSPKPQSSLKDNEYYEKAKEHKRIKDKELRKKLKPTTKRARPSITESEYYQQAKELKRHRDKELRKKIKEQRDNAQQAG